MMRSSFCDHDLSFHNRFQIPFSKVTMHSPHDDGHSMYIVNLETGATEVVGIPDDIIFDHPLEVPGGYNASSAGYHKRDIDRRSIPANGYK